MAGGGRKQTVEIKDKGDIDEIFLSILTEHTAGDPMCKPASREAQVYRQVKRMTEELITVNSPINPNFDQQLDKLADNSFIQLHAKAQDALEKPAISQTHFGTGDNVAGNKTEIGRQINQGLNSVYNGNNSKD